MVIYDAAHEYLAPEPTRYPSAWEFDSLLTNGEAVCIRPVRTDDARALVAFHAQLSDDTIHRRFFGVHPVSFKEASHFADVDYHDRMGFVAILAEQLIAFASYERLGPSDSCAEIAFVVADEYQRHGAATLLFESLAAYARAIGIEGFVAEVMAENADMLRVFGATGLRATRIHDDGTVRIDIDLSSTAEYRDSCDAREATAEAASASAILRPRSIAVVGASRHPGNVGHEIVQSLLDGGFAGDIYPVNPAAATICGLPAFSTLSATPNKVDLAIIAIPADSVPPVVEEAAAAGVRAVTIITAGFAETGRSGAEVEAELLTLARARGMRIVGPNCLGILNTDPEVRMNATFAGLDPLPGRLALISQSGAVGIVLAEEANAAGLGLSSFVSIGNKLDVSSNDLLCFFEHDPRTSVIALYLESLGNPRKFARIARRVGMQKPIVALKAGRTTAGARGARSHTAAAATSEVTVSALFRGAGVIEVNHLEELLDVSTILLGTPLPFGRRVALVGNSGGPLILTADACEADGLLVPELGETTRNILGQRLVAAAAVANPIDLTADGTASSLEATLEIVLDDDGIDAVIVVVTDLVALSAPDARAAIARVAQQAEKPIVACIFGRHWEHATGVAEIAELPTPERVAAALGHVCRYAEWQRRPKVSNKDSGVMLDNPTVREIIATKLSNNAQGGWLELEESTRMLEACGVPMLATRAAQSADEAASLAQSLGFPVVLKARSGAIVHKSDVGGVAMGLANAQEVHDAFETMSSRLGTAMGGAVVQPTAEPGIEAIVGLVADPTYGPIIMVGLGGVMTDLLGDHAFVVPPLEPGGADAMVRSLRAAPLLDGYRGTPMVDRDALVAVLEAIAKVAEEVPELVELDLNPIVVSSTGAVVVDCKARVAPRHPGPGPLFRALRRSVHTQE